MTREQALAIDHELTVQALARLEGKVVAVVPRKLQRPLSAYISELEARLEALEHRVRMLDAQLEAAK